MKEVKRLFLAGFLAFTFAVLGATLSPSTSSAEDVWFYSDGEWAFYLNTNTVKDRGNKVPRYTVNVKKVISGKFQGDFEILGFTSKNGKIYCAIFSRYNMKWEYESPIDNDPYSTAAWNALRPYI